MKPIMAGKVISFPDGGRQVVTSAVERTPEDATILRAVATELARHPKTARIPSDAEVDETIDAIVTADGELLRRARLKHSDEYKAARQKRMLAQFRAAAEAQPAWYELPVALAAAIAGGAADMTGRGLAALLNGAVALPGMIVRFFRRLGQLSRKDSHMPWGGLVGTALAWGLSGAIICKVIIAAKYFW